MKSHRRYWEETLERAIDDRLERTGAEIADGIQTEIRSQQLIETLAMLESIDYEHILKNEIRVGTPIDGYPYYLNVGFIHQYAGPVGPYRFMEQGWERR